jgi:hypothetical protein
MSFLAIAITIIVTMVDAAELASFYEDAYSRAPAEAAVYARWRALGARGKHRRAHSRWAAATAPC